MKNISASAAQLHRLVYAGLMPKERVKAAFSAEDPRHDVDVWRAFARSTVLPLGIAVVVVALVLAAGAKMDEGPEKASAAAFALGAFAALVVALINTGKRALWPAGLTLLFCGLLIAGNIARVDKLRREEDVAAFLLVVVTAGCAWALARTRRWPGTVALDDDAIAFIAPMSTAKRVACALVWIVGTPIAIAAFALFMDERDLGIPQIILGLVMFAVGAIVSRRRKPLAIARHAGLLAFITGTVFVSGALLEHVDIDRDMRPLLIVPVLLVGWLAVRSWPVRALWGAVLAAVVLAFFADLDISAGDVQRSDDVFVVVVAALTTFALTRGRYVRPVGAAGALALLVFAAVEVPSIGGVTHLGLGTFTSLGATACAMAAALVVLRGASVAARALVCALLFFAGALYIDAPAIVLSALVLLLARQARLRFLELIAFLAILVAGWALVDKPWALLDMHAIKAALTAIVLLAMGLTLRGIPSTASPGAAAAAADAAAPMTRPPSPSSLPTTT